MTNADSTTWHTSVVSRLSESGALEGKPTLMLVDEIQRFNTLDHEESGPQHEVQRLLGVAQRRAAGAP
ncbi:MAG: hypothetical protein U0Q10_05475 [Dermatophilaceae bacterium]